VLFDMPQSLIQTLPGGPNQHLACYHVMILKIPVNYPSTMLLIIKTIAVLHTNSSENTFNKTSLISKNRCLSSNYVFLHSVTCKIRSTSGKSVNMFSSNKPFMKSRMAV
jgi:hypothetical protein